jgi:hypothetical protein
MRAGVARADNSLAAAGHSRGSGVIVRKASRSVSLTVAALVAVVGAVYVLVGYHLNAGQQSDFDQIWYGARALRNGLNPYAEIGPNAAGFPAPFPLFYPLTALLPPILVSWFDVAIARAVFSAASAFAFTYLLLRTGTHRWPGLLSASFVYSLSLVQYSPLLACAFITPVYGWVTVCKPNVGVAVLAGARSNRWLAISLGGAILLVIASLILLPSWPRDWLEAVRLGKHFRPFILRPGGVLMLLALLRWRRPEARWMAVLSVMPGTPGLCEALVLFTVTRSRRESILLALGTYAALFATYPSTQFETFEAFIARGALATLAFVYLPGLIAILRRPNEGEVPLWLDRVTARISGKRYSDAATTPSIS